MKPVKMLALGAVVVLSLMGSAAAPAANWHPQNTTFTANQEGSGSFTFPDGDAVRCSAASVSLSASGAVAMNTAATNPVTFTNCLETVLNTAVTVTTFGTWNFTATSTTSVDLEATSATSVVVLIHMPGLGCTVSLRSTLSIPNNTWSNAAHTLTINNTPTIVSQASSTACGLFFEPTATWDAKFQFPNTVTIT